MLEIIKITTNKHNGLYDITSEVKEIILKSKVKNGLVNVYAQGATSAIMIQENWDESVQSDVINFLKKIIPQGVWLFPRG